MRHTFDIIAARVLAWYAPRENPETYVRHNLDWIVQARYHLPNKYIRSPGL